MTVRLSDAQRTKLCPTRASGTARAPDAASAKKALRAFKDPKRLTPLRQGIETAVEPALAPLRRAAWALLEKPSLEAIAEADLETLAGAERMFSYGAGGITLTDAILVARGVADAVEVQRRALRYDLGSEGNWTYRVFLVTAGGTRRTRVDPWLPLRHAVCAAPPADYAAARTRALEEWDARSPLDNARFAYVFPDEPWGAALLSLPEAALAVHTNHHGMPHRLAELGFLLTACRDAKVAREFIARASAGYWVGQAALELAVALAPEDAVPLLAEALPTLLKKPGYGPVLKTPPREVLAAIAVIETDEAATIVAGYVGHRILGALAEDHFRERPDRRAALHGVSGKAARALYDALEGGARPSAAEAAPQGAVPPLLRARPWRAPQGKMTRVVVPDVALPEPLEERVVLPERVETSRYEPLTGEKLDAWRVEAREGRTWIDLLYDHKGRVYYAVPPAEGLALWNRGAGWLTQSPTGFLAQHGLAATAGFVARAGGRLGNLDYEGAEEWMDAYERLLTPRAAPLFARIASARKRWRSRAHAWLEAHAAIAAVGLIPDAVGPVGAARSDAESALLHMARAGHREAVEAASARYPAEVRAVVDALLARDPMQLEGKPPKPPPFLRVGALPQLEVAQGSLDDDARDAALELLSVAPPEHPGFTVLRAACTAASLSALVMGLLEQWAAADGPGRHDWMLRAAVALPSDEATREVCALARAWARDKQACALRACEALAAIGDDRALLTLGHVAATTRFKTLRAEAAAHLDRIAIDRGLTREELEDRTVPDLGLGPDGALHLTVGARVLRASFDETLAAVLLDPDGARLRAFPRAQAGEEAAHGAAKERYEALKKDVAAIADRQRRRLERAMVARRAWSLEDARRFFFDHPLGRHLARGLVWRYQGGAFRLAEDGTLADHEEELLTLAPSEAVWIAHPLELEARDAWVTIFSDYELLSPFEQLGREVFVPTADELTQDVVRRAEGLSVRGPKLLGALEARGWERDSASTIQAYEKRLAGGLALRLPLSPGIEIAYLRDDGGQTLGAVEIRRGADPARALELDPVDFSELVLDLSALR